MVDLDATLGEKLFEVPVGQPVPQVPAHRQQDHLGRETESSEPRGHPHRRSRTASALHRATLTATVRSVNATEPSIGIGRTHTGTRVIVLSQDLDIRVIDAATGELLRELILDTSKRTKALDARQAPHAK